MQHFLLRNRTGVCERSNRTIRKSENMNITANGSGCSRYSSQNWRNHCLLPDIRRFAAWEFLYSDNCIQNAKFEKTNQLFFHPQHGHVRPAVSNIPDPTGAYLYVRRLLAYQWPS